MAYRGSRFGFRPHAWVRAGDNPFSVLMEQAQVAERLGFDGIFFGDRLLAQARSQGDVIYAATMPELFVSLAAIATATRTIQLGTLVLVLPFRHPLMVAKQVASLDLLSNGRVILGVGAGWNEVEFRALGLSRAEAGARLAEMVPLLRRLWTEEDVSHEGRFFRCAGVNVEPKPARPGGPPVWFGSFTPDDVRIQGNALTPGIERVLERVAALADAWVPMTYSVKSRCSINPGILGLAWERLQSFVERAGRPAGSVQFVFSHWYHIIVEDEDRLEAERAIRRFFPGTWDEAVATYLIGPADQILEKIHATTARIPRVDWYLFTPLSPSPRQIHLLKDLVVDALAAH